MNLSENVLVGTIVCPIGESKFAKLTGSAGIVVNTSDSTVSTKDSKMGQKVDKTVKKGPVTIVKGESEQESKGGYKHGKHTKKKSMQEVSNMCLFASVDKGMRSGFDQGTRKRPFSGLNAEVKSYSRANAIKDARKIGRSQCMDQWKVFADQWNMCEAWRNWFKTQLTWHEFFSMGVYGAGAPKHFCQNLIF